jgi:nitrite reductase/ring-hydroxylating ferredoxin subunit
MGEGTQQALRRTAQASGKDVSVWYRRDVFSAAGWAAVFVATMTAIMGFMRYMFPRVLFEPPTTFKAGVPTEFALGAVNEKFKKDQRVWIVRQEDGGFFAISAICTHLGCTPNWFANDNKFKLLGKVMASVAPLHRVRHQPWACPGALSRVISNRRSVGSSTLLVVLRMRCPCDGR